MPDEERIDLDLDVVTNSGGALLLSDGEVEAWIGFSLLECEEEDPRLMGAGEHHTFSIPVWVAEKEGLV